MKHWKILIGIACSALFLFLAFRSVRWHELTQAFRNSDYRAVVPAMLLLLVSLVIRVFRWRYLLHPMKDIKMASLFHATAIGAMVNITLPARVGELVRAHVIGRKECISRSASFATIVVERVFDGFALLFFLAVVVLFGSTHPPEWLRDAEYVALFGYVVALAALVLLKTRTRMVLRFTEVVLKLFPRVVRNKVIGVSASFIDGLQVFTSTRNMLTALVLSPVVWFPTVVMVYLLLLSTGIHLPFLISFLLLVALCIGVIVPSAPGFIGNVQLVSLAVLKLFGVPASQALTFSLIYNACIFVPIFLTGFVCLVAEGLSFREIETYVGLKR